MYNEQYDDLIKTILAAGKKVADEVEVFCSEGRGVSVELRRKIIGEAEEGRSFGIVIRTIQNGHIGVSSTSDPVAWESCLHAAVASGHLATPQNWEGLPGQKDVADSLQICDPALDPNPETAVTLLADLLEGASAHPAAVIGGSASLSAGRSILANSSGLWYEREKTSVGVSLECIDGTSTGYEFDRSCFLNEIDAGKVGERGAFLATHHKDGEQLATGEYDIILSPNALGQFFEYVVVPAFSGRNVHAGRSFLAEKLGEQVFDSELSLVDDPFNGPGSTLFDGDGVATKTLDLIENGVVGTFMYDLKTAYRYGEVSTASALRGSVGGPGIGPHNLILHGRESAVDDEKALYVQDVIGAHTANPVTGDFSVELSNTSWKQDGVYGKPVASAMLSGNIFEMLGGSCIFGQDRRRIGSISLPSVRFNKQKVICT